MALFNFSDVITPSEKTPAKPKSSDYPIPEDYTGELVSYTKSFKDVGVFDDFTKEKYPSGILFYDFEVFKNDWLVVLIDPVNCTKDLIVNDRSTLLRYYRTHREMIWAGYNVLHYDVPILKGILSGMDPKKISDAIIEEGKNGWSLVPTWNKWPLITYDVMAQLTNAPSLKVLEAYMGSDIEETSVPFDLDRQLSKSELEMTSGYCNHDVEQTIEVFRRSINEFNAIMRLLDMYDFPLSYLEKTKGQLTAMVVDCERKEHDDEFDVTIVPSLKLEKYAYVRSWFEKILKMKDYKAVVPNTPENAEILSKGKQVKKGSDSRTMFETMVCGIPHQFGWGGLHGAPIEPIHITGKMYHADVTSYYPSMMIGYNFLTRNSKSPEKFKNVYDTRVALKKAGDKLGQAPLKIILNAQFGITKDKFSTAYDPVQANNICINGQLLLLDLLEKLEFRLGERFQLLQSNTDGVIFKIAEDEKSEKIMRHIINEWCERNKLGMGVDGLKKIIQRDVNNYLFVFENGKLERKGAYLMELSDLSNDLPIVNEAMIEYMTKGTPVEDTVDNCNELIKFQKVYRVSSSYKFGWHNGKVINDRTFRVFASKDKRDGYIARCRDYGATPEKFQNSPEHCFIYNKCVKDVELPIKLDKKWYINLAKKRLVEFGYELQQGNSLF